MDDHKIGDTYAVYGGAGRAIGESQSGSVYRRYFRGNELPVGEVEGNNVMNHPIARDRCEGS